MVKKPASHPPFLGGSSASHGPRKMQQRRRSGRTWPRAFFVFFLGTSGPLGLLGPLGPGCFILVIPKASPMTDLLGSDDAPDSHLLSRNVSKWLII